MSKVAEAYKAGRARIPRWTKQDLVADTDNGVAACAIGAFAVGAGLLDVAEVRADGYVAGADGIRDAFRDLFQDVTIPYNCSHAEAEKRALDTYRYYDDSPVATVIEHLSDEHRRSLGRDHNLLRLMEKYGKN